jgi:beta-glucosidase
VLLALAALLVAPLGAPSSAWAASGSGFPFQNPRLSLQVRLDDLMSRLTQTEQIEFLHQYQPAIPRLGIQTFKMGTEAVHGLAWSNDPAVNNGAQVYATATTFPQAPGLASTWDTGLINQVGSVVGNDARGYYAMKPTVWGTNLWAPVVNLLRDPRWGRNEEGYSEDPILTGAISSAYGSGIEGNNPFYLKAAPTLKHYLAYNNEVRRDTTSSELPQRVLNEYDRAAFQPAISAGAATGVMSSYNLVNGRPDTVNPDLNSVERSWTDQTLVNVTDAFAPYNLTGSEAYYATNPAAFAAIVKAGLNSFTIDNSNSQPMVAALQSALSQGLLSWSDIDRAVRQVLTLRFRLGSFDPDGGPYGSITPSILNRPADNALARQTADEATVLLKNQGGALPLNASTTRKVAVIGPLENTLYADWYGGNMPYQVTPLQGIQQRLGSGATVSGTEGVDRIALQDPATGKFVTAGSGASGAPLAESATSADATTQFDVFDWGQGQLSDSGAPILTLRSVANGKYVGYNFANFVNDQAQPNGWFVQQQFELQPRPDGNVVIRYAGYETAETWFTPKHYVTLQPDGTLNIGGAATPDQATEFHLQTIVSGAQSAAAAAGGADAAVVVVGSMPFINGRENHDRTTMALSQAQEAMVKAVQAANPHTVMVLETSYPDTINWEQQNVPAVLWTTHAGQETGHAIADVLFGDYNPAGRLTQTWYQSDSQLPSILNYDIIKDNRTYLYFDGSPLYPFGYGLSYTTFRYSELRVGGSDGRAATTSDGRDGTITASVDVTNTGGRAGDEVVQLYTHQLSSRDKEPLRQLQAFQRVHLAPGQTRTVRLKVPVADLAHWDVTRGRWVVESSAYDFMVGSSSADIRQQATLRVDGQTIPPRDLASTTRAESFDDYSGVMNDSSALQLVDETKAAGTAVGVTGTGWIKFAGAGLGRGPETFTASVARAAAGSGSIEVRLDSPTGPLVGTAQVPSTGDKYTYTTTTAALSGAGGRHDVYLVLNGDQRLATFSMR